jgi:hypothetical protein
MGGFAEVGHEDSKINQNLFLRKSEDLKMGKLRGVRAE